MSAPRYLTLVLVSVFGFTLLGYSQTQATCTFTYFNPPSGYTGDFFPMGINHYNTAVGGIYTNTLNNGEKGYIRYSGGGVTLYSFPGATFTQFNRRNVNGTTVGQYNINTGGWSAGLIYTSSSVASLKYPNANSTVLNGINKYNTMVGTEIDAATGAQYGFKYQNGTFTRVRYPNSSQTVVNSINDNGVIVGGYETGGFEGPWFGFILQNGVFKTVSYMPMDINNAGVWVDSQNIHFTNGVVKQVKVPGSVQTWAYGINDLGVITGSASFGPNSQGNYTWKGYTAVCH